jgi:hypothetical protein
MALGKGQLKSGESGEKEMNKPLMDILAEGHYAANLDAVPGESYNTAIFAQRLEKVKTKIH